MFQEYLISLSVINDNDRIQMAFPITPRRRSHVDRKLNTGRSKLIKRLTIVKIVVLSLQHRDFIEERRPPVSNE
ncbi:hypothetical protein M0802_003076 [Mischocyttarus mexicanus]|nr:hypothetical protein M0802_003076 [Mischocyttarus mexicanus]